ncbi:MAG TPA: sodium:alanine symporter family protein [candidate division Zixibacteria bacterium]|nr:sodium:alanine symporter family protein [candidate division Zixibacteria bacterium]
MQTINHLLSTAANWIWGEPYFAMLLLGTGIFLTIRLGAIQIRGFAHGLAIVSGKYDDPAHQGQLTHFQALCAALSATIGIGNISGVAIALYFGGPGAIFWMWISALFGMALKYTSCTLAIKFRKIDPDGNVRGGPMYFIELGMSKSLRPLAYMFAVCTAFAAFGCGNMAQSNTIAHSIIEAFGIGSGSETIVRIIIGLILAGLVALVIIGGIKRIGSVASYLVPFMSVAYVGSALIVLAINYDRLIPCLQSIFFFAFNPTAAAGGFAGAGVWFTIQHGLRRGLFSNESGLGSAPMAHSTAKVEEPVREGLVAMLGPFIDTIVICTMTALVILSTGQWGLDPNTQGVSLTMAGFQNSLGEFGRWMVVLAVLLFGYSTSLSWSYYGEKGIEYVLGTGAKRYYRWIYVLFIFLGAVLKIQAVWDFSDMANGLMAFPNLVALIGLSGVMAAMTRKYMDEKARGLHKPFR